MKKSRDLHNEPAWGNKILLLFFNDSFNFLLSKNV